MTLRHFQILQAVAETESFTQAAKKLYITQSAVSHAIRELEEASNTPLFDRLSKRIRITKSGQLLLEQVLPILTAFQNLEARIGNLEQQAPIHLVSSITIAIYHLPAILSKFARLWPAVLVEVEVVSAAAAMEVLQQGRADLALIEGTMPQGTFIGTAFSSYQLLPVCAPGYPAATRSLSLADFAAEKLLLREKGSAIRDALDSALYLLGYTVYPIWCSVNSLPLIAAAKAGLGITVLPEILIRQELTRGLLVPVAVPDLTLHNQMIAVHHQDKYLTAPLRSLLSLFTAKDSTPV